MSRKRRENHKKHEDQQRFALKPVHFVIGVVVIALSAAAAIGAVTLLGGASLSGEDKVNLPALGAPLPAGRSAAADLLGGKTWDEMSAEEQELAKSEFNRVYDNVSFRASNGRIIGIDIFRRDGNTRVSRQYSALRGGIEPAGKVNYGEALIFYCPAENNQVHAVRYDKLPLTAQAGDAIQEKRAQPFDILISGINWEQGVVDLGWRDFEGMRLHGLRVVYNSNQPELPNNRKEAEYWFDVETARLIQRQALIPDQDTSQERYTIQWREVPPIVVPPDQPHLDCVDDVLAKVAP